MSNTYFWKDSKVVTIPKSLTLSEVQREFRNLPCVDTYYSDPAQRYGTYTNTGWESISMHDLPKGFLVHVLLLT